jgi:GTP-binding protein Era
MIKENTQHKFGTIVLMGEPNVGKSSLVNALTGEPVAVVTDMAGTTREQIRGILTGDDWQAVFVDTPGMNKAHTSLDKFMNKSISNALANSDIILYVLDATDIAPQYIQKIKNLRDKKPIIVAVNKVDRVKMENLYPKLAELNELSFVKAIVPTSCTREKNIQALRTEIIKLLPAGAAQHEADDFTTQPMKKMAEEIVRAELIKALRAEIPHGIAVQVVKYTDKPKEAYIKADIICAKQSHKPMVIGKKGSVLKAVGIAARKQLQEVTGKHIRLETFVVVREGWKDKSDVLDGLGYTT